MIEVRIDCELCNTDEATTAYCDRCIEVKLEDAYNSGFETGKKEGREEMKEELTTEV